MLWQFIVLSLLPSTLAALDPALCTSIRTCIAYGKLPCDRDEQVCPPCIYTDAKGQFLCFDKVAGTSLCPFINTKADCSDGTIKLPELVNKTTPQTTETPTTLPPEETSSWNGLSIGLMVTTMLLFLGLSAVIVIWYIRRRNNLERRQSTPIQIMKPTKPSLHSPRHSHILSPPAGYMSDTYMETQSITSARSVSFCHIMEPARESRPSDAF